MARYKFDKAFEEHFIQVCKKSLSMSQAALTLEMNYKTVCFHAKRLDCFITNQSGKGISKPIVKGLISIQDIFDGKCKTFQSHKLKKRLLKENYKDYKCENCNLEIWLNKPIPLELHHLDGNRYNNALENLQLLCPNCHALTENYRAKNIRNLSAHLETNDVEPLKFGEAFTGNPEPSSVKTEKV
jgi:hypothetical protein